MYVLFTGVNIPSNVSSLRLPIRALPPPALPSAVEHQNSISSPTVFSRRATRSPYPTSTPHNMLTRQLLTPGDAAAWNWPVDGGSRVHAHDANRKFLRILLARTESPLRKMNRGWRNRSSGRRRMKALLGLWTLNIARDLSISRCPHRLCLTKIIVFSSVINTVFWYHIHAFTAHRAKQVKTLDWYHPLISSRSQKLLLLSAVLKIRILVRRISQ